MYITQLSLPGQSDVFSYQNTGKSQSDSLPASVTTPLEYTLANQRCLWAEVSSAHTCYYKLWKWRVNDKVPGAVGVSDTLKGDLSTTLQKGNH